MYTNIFKSNIDELSQGYTKFMVSRLVSNPRDKIVETQIPTNIPDSIIVEISLYSLEDDYLVYNVAFESTDSTGIYIRTIQYSNNEIRKLLFVDFSSIKDNFPTGEFRLVLNLYVPEIGEKTEPVLETVAISPSRYELEMQLTPEYDTPEYRESISEFIKPQLTQTTVLTAIDQIFGISTTEQIPSDNSLFSYDTVKNLFPAGLNDEIIDDLEIATTDIMQNAYTQVVSTITDDISAGKTRFTDSYLQQIISQKIIDAYDRYTTNLAQATSIFKVTLTTNGII